MRTVTWSEANAQRVTRQFEGAATPVEAGVDFDGTPAWLPADDLDFTAEPPSGIRVLPSFGALAIAAFPRERFFPGRAFRRALAGGQAGNYPVVLVDGEVAGVWHQRKAGRRVRVTVGLTPDALT